MWPFLLMWVICVGYLWRAVSCFVFFVVAIYLLNVTLGVYEINDFLPCLAWTWLCCDPGSELVLGLAAERVWRGREQSEGLAGHETPAWGKEAHQEQVSLVAGLLLHPHHERRRAQAYKRRPAFWGGDQPRRPYSETFSQATCTSAGGTSAH